MPPYPLTPSKDMLFDDVDRSNKRQKLDETYLSLDGISSIFSIKDIGADELPCYEWTLPEEFINFEMGIEESLAFDSSENKDAVFIIDADLFSFQETPSEEKSAQSRDLIDNDSSLEVDKEIPDSTSLEESTDADEEISWLDFVARYDADGKKCIKEDIQARKIEIMEELEMISQTVQRMKEEDVQKQEELSLLNHPKKFVQKIKVDCPHCQKKVAAVRFVPHLSKCFGKSGRKCTRQRQSP